ncbi:hypothetical protein RF11_08783 [Thelohanellus kitauei]|uniref:Uncharacterized protein n=1 Tax=Thelohanellus kitauei TaxID=669202 RepID=A0A0C2NBF4_THEKT|nr:hypothetical protein RF11_08783 [Thelohanellus kitauei]
MKKMLADMLHREVGAASSGSHLKLNQEPDPGQGTLIHNTLGYLVRMENDPMMFLDKDTFLSYCDISNNPSTPSTESEFALELSDVTRMYKSKNCEELWNYYSACLLEDDFMNQILDLVPKKGSMLGVLQNPVHSSFEQTPVESLGKQSSVGSIFEPNLDESRDVTNLVGQSVDLAQQMNQLEWDVLKEPAFDFSWIDSGRLSSGTARVYQSHDDANLRSQ